MVGSPVVSVLLAVNEASILVCTTCCVLAVECLKRSAFSNSNMQYLSQWSPANQAVTLYSFDFFQITIEHFCNICLSVFFFFLKTKNNCGGFQLWVTKSYTSRKYRAELSLTSPVMCSEHTDSVKWVLLNRAHFFFFKEEDFWCNKVVKTCYCAGCLSSLWNIWAVQKHCHRILI